MNGLCIFVTTKTSYVYDKSNSCQSMSSIFYSVHCCVLLQLLNSLKNGTLCNFLQISDKYDLYLTKHPLRPNLIKIANHWQNLFIFPRASLNTNN